MWCELFCLIHFFSFVLSSAALSQYTFFYGLQYTTATFAITFTNMAPVLTFLIAVLLRCSRIQTFSFPAPCPPVLSETL
jgi:drug/metabolite transporter (DMT)-like permease